ELRERDSEGTVLVIEPDEAEDDEPEESESNGRSELAPPPPGHETIENVRIYPYAVSRNRLERAIRVLGVTARIVRSLEDADLVLTIKGQDRRRLAESGRVRERNLPVHVLRSNTTAQIQDFLARYFRISDTATEELALREAEEAIRRVLRNGQPADLAPQRSSIRQLQHDMAERYAVRSRSFGTEPQRYVRIYK
ncbi:MAG: R3H domain-containing nucleic acid-binding protein, partial [Candidatus Eremiobacterota bacterium]